MVLVWFADGTTREIFGANSATLEKGKFLVTKWMMGEKRYGLVNVFPAEQVVKAEIKVRGEIKQVVIGGAK